MRALVLSLLPACYQAHELPPEPPPPNCQEALRPDRPATLLVAESDEHHFRLYERTLEGESRLITAIAPDLVPTWTEVPDDDALQGSVEEWLATVRVAPDARHATVLDHGCAALAYRGQTWSILELVSGAIHPIQMRDDERPAGVLRGTWDVVVSGPRTGIEVAPFDAPRSGFSSGPHEGIAFGEGIASRRIVFSAIDEEGGAPYPESFPFGYLGTLPRSVFDFDVETGDLEVVEGCGYSLPPALTPDEETIVCGADPVVAIRGGAVQVLPNPRGEAPLLRGQLLTDPSGRFVLVGGDRWSGVVALEGGEVPDLLFKESPEPYSRIVYAGFR